MTTMLLHKRLAARVAEFVESRPRYKPLFELIRVTITYFGVSIPFEVYNFSALLFLESMGYDPAWVWIPLWIYDVSGKYVMNSQITWRDNGLSRSKFIKYWVIAIIGGLAQYVVFLPLHIIIPTGFALLAAKLVNTAINILGNHFLTFRKLEEA